MFYYQPDEGVLRTTLSQAGTSEAAQDNESGKPPFSQINQTESGESYL